MHAALTAALGVVAVGLLAAFVVAVRTGRRGPVAVAVPSALVAAVPAVLADGRPSTAWLLVATLLVAPAPLARLARRRAAWPVLGVFAVAGVVAAYGSLGRLLCLTSAEPCDSPGADVAMVVGGGVAGAAALWLYATGALGR